MLIATLFREEGPQARACSKWLNRRSFRERLAKEAFWLSASRGLKKDSDRAISPAQRQSLSLDLGTARVPASQEAVPPSCSTLTGAEMPQAKKTSCMYVCRVASVVSDSLQSYRLWPARLLCQGEGFSRQEYWSVLANTGCHTLLERYISCCPSLQSPWVPGAARAPATQAAATSTPGPHRGNPSPPGQPQEQTPVDDPHAEVEIKPQLKPRGGVTKEEDSKLSHQLYKLQIKSTRSTKQILCLWNI